MRYFLYAFSAIVLLVIVLFGFRGHKFTSTPVEFLPDMDHQPKYKSQTESPFFSDGRTDRVPVKGTIPYGKPLATTYYGSGKIEDRWGDGIPPEVPVTPALLKRGQERYNINCAICHGEDGSGNGVTSKYGLVGIANLHQQNFVAMADGQLFHTITYGKGNMGGYAHIKVDDRWAIVSYVRALQRSHKGKAEDLSPEMKEQLK